jgi:hypothetical protein
MKIIWVKTMPLAVTRKIAYDCAKKINCGASIARVNAYRNRAE